jgi:DNA polymerase I-like protein with 3'-5' exonuclease and polymerase domains
MAQVPGSKAPYGERCRALFTVPQGKKLVGCDADALELCCLAGYMARYDNGAYIKVVLEGDKSQGTDIHSVNARALGLDPKQKYPVNGKNVTGRDIAKVWFYAFIYGAGDMKLGFILGETNEAKAKKKGKKSRQRFLENLPALKTLTEKVKAMLKKRGHLKGLDGRRLHPRFDHSALNTLLQSAGAVIMKMALVIADEALIGQEFLPGRHYEFVANVHDEFQIEADEDRAETVGRMAKDSIRLAGERLGFACPLSGSFDIGDNWAQTH